MKTYLFYRSRSEDESTIRDFLQSLKTIGDDEHVIMQDVNTRDASERARLYDIMVFPTLLTTTNDGVQVQIWKQNMPTLGEITYYLKQL